MKKITLTFLLFSTLLTFSQENCGSIIDLGALSSPYNGDTTGAANDFGEDCLTNAGAPDQIFSIDVATGLELNISQTVNSYDSKHRVAYGNTCPGDQLIACIDDPDTQAVVWVNSTGATQTVYWTQSAFSTGSGTFTLEWSVGTPAPPPANDECAAMGAQLLIASSDATCTSTSGTTENSTQTLAGCAGTANDDVWYRFVAVSGSQNILISNTGGTSDIVTEVFDACGGTSILCQDTPNSPIKLTGLTVGAEYFFRIYSWSSTATVFSAFDVCVITPPPPPANDACVDATNISSLPFTATLDATGATNNDGFIAVTDCGSMNDGVWYTFTTVDAGTVDIAISAVTGMDPELAIYSGSCVAFTCVDNVDAGFEDDGESLSAVPVEAATQYWINIGNFSGFTDGSEGQFTLDLNTTDSTTLGFDALASLENIFSYYPNPVKRSLTLDAQQNIDAVIMYNMLGQEVLRLAPNNISTTVDMSNLNVGTYFAHVSISGNTQTVRVIKQ